MAERRLIILGAGGYGRTVADVARQTGRYAAVAHLDDAAAGAEILGACADFPRFQDDATEFYPAFGDNRRRVEWLERLEMEGCCLATIVHPRAYVSPTATLAAGCVVLPFAVVNTGCALAWGCIVNCGAVIDHGCVLEEGVHVCLNATVKAENHLPAFLKVEAGQVVPNRQYA